MSRATQNLVLLLVGLSTALMVAKGSYVYYVKPTLLPWLITAAVVLVALAITAIVRDLRRHGATADADHAGHQHRNWMVWLLVIPIALTAFVVPPPLGSHGAAPAITADSEPQRVAWPPLPPGESPTVSLPEVLMRSATDSTGSLDGRPITTTGFTIKAGDSADLGRVVIVCCAADAQLARIHLTGPAATTAAELPDGTWLQIRGHVDTGTSPTRESDTANKFIPTMAVSSVERIDKPANTYAY